jgi:hypothetical protein
VKLRAALFQVLVAGEELLGGLQALPRLRREQVFIKLQIPTASRNPDLAGSKR